MPLRGEAGDGACGQLGSDMRTPLWVSHCPPAPVSSSGRCDNLNLSPGVLSRGQKRSGGECWADTSLVCRRTALSSAAAQRFLCLFQVAQHSPVLRPLQKGGILWNCHANGLILHPRKAATSLPPPGPAPCLPGSEPVAPRVLDPPGSRAGRDLLVVSWGLSTEPGTKPQGLSPNEERSALPMWEQ